MSIANNFPAIKPSLNLDFANTKKLDPRVTFARASTGAYYDGQTVAKAEENLLLQSQDFATSWTPVRATVTVDTTTAPDGTTTADSVLLTSGNTSYGGVSQNISITAGNVSASVFAKPNGKDFLIIQEDLLDGTGNITWFDVSTGVVGTTDAGHTAVITASTNGFYRCSISFTANANRTGSIRYYFADTDGSTTVADDGNGLYLWGAQLEQRDTVTAYTPTTTQPITNYIPVLQTADANVARFDHNPVTQESLGLLVEEQRTNLLTYSEDFSNAAWSKADSTVTANTIVAPDGALSGYTLTGSSGTGISPRILNITTTISSTIYAGYFYVKKGTHKYIQLVANGVAGVAANFDIEAGIVTQTFGTITAAIAPAGNNWYRCSIVYTSANTAGLTVLNMIPSSDSARNANWNPTGYETIYIWGAQLEAGSFPTSYIKTEASQVTRSADSASMTGENFSSWYRADEGTVYSEIKGAEPTGSTGVVYQIDDTSANNRVVQNYGTAVTVIVNNSAQASLALGSSVPSTLYKVATAFAFNDFASSRNGETLVTDNSGLTPLVSRLVIGNDNSATSYLNGTIKRLTYYPQRLSNENLQALTS